MSPITPDLLVDDVMRRWPAAIRVLLQFRFLCVGCPIACFHAVSQACREHHTDEATFPGALHGALAGDTVPALA